MTRNQENTLRFVYWFHRDHGKPPTQLEVGKEFQISRVAARNRLRGLERAGFVEQKFLEHRSVRLTVAGLRAIGQTDDRWPFTKTEEADED